MKSTTRSIVSLNFSLCAYLFMVGLLASTAIYGQADSTQVKAKGDTTTLLSKVTDRFAFIINKKAIAKDPSLYPAKMVLAPVISYSPEFNWGIGVGAKFLFKFRGSGAETRTSNMPMTAQYTLNNQFFLTSGYTIFFNQEKYLLKGNIGYSQFPRLFYGIGNNTPKSAEEVYTYNTFLLEPLLLKRVIGKLFIGGGFRFNTSWDVTLEPDSKLRETPLPGYTGSRSAGLETAITYDSRDNVLNALHGMLIEFTHGRYNSSVGSTHTFALTKFDMRQYIKVFANRDDIFAFQLFGFFSSGNTPLIELPALGGDELMRGYYRGRFVGNNYLAGQIEYRLPVTKSFGVVGFVGTGQIADKLDSFSWRQFKPSFGLGVRFKIVQEEDLNIRFDYGFGKNTSNYYFNVAEAF